MHDDWLDFYLRKYSKPDTIQTITHSNTMCNVLTLMHEKNKIVRLWG
jgi:hypothetical protein